MKVAQKTSSNFLVISLLVTFFYTQNLFSQDYSDHTLATREEILMAARGDISVIEKLLMRWNCDYKELKETNDSYSFLTGKEWNEVKHLLKTLKSSKDIQNREINRRLPFSILDDCGKKIDLKESHQLFLPQTYVSAAFLMALLPHKINTKFGIFSDIRSINLSVICSHSFL